MGHRVNSVWAAVVAAIVLVGCDAKPAPVPVRPDVTDVRPPARRAAAVLAAYAPPPLDTSAVIPVAPQPVTESPAPAAASAVEFATPATPVALTTSTPARRTHTVRRGETLTAIARATYGDPSQWHRLAAANPAAAGGSLRVGQQLVLP